MNTLQFYLHQVWYHKHPLFYLLLPFSWVYIAIATLKKLCYQIGILAIKRVDVPVIIVGNISAGGAGKTPLVIWLANYLTIQGMKVGIVSRGYGGVAYQQPQQVRIDSSPLLVGDEAVLCARRTHCPVAVCVDRVRAVEELIKVRSCDVIVGDDGLQYYGLDRDIEIVVIDGKYRYGNGHYLPAGPLRESVKRLQQVDMVVNKNYSSRREYTMQYEYGDLVSLTDPNVTCSIEKFISQPVHALAGIGHPENFFAYLRQQQLLIIAHHFRDHYQYRKKDLQFGDNLPLIMTEKDAVKCEGFELDNCWYVPIVANLSDAFQFRLDILLKELTRGQKTA